MDSALAYGPGMSIEALLAAIIGGSGTIFGPLLGALVLVGLREFTETLTHGAPGVSHIFFAILLLVMLRFMPNGLLGAVRSVGNIRKWWSSREKTRA